MTSTGHGQLPAHSTAFDTLSTLLHTRYSCRSFLPEPLPRATIEAILVTAQRTASWCNAQPWQLTIASGATLERLRVALQSHMANAAPAPDLPWPREYRGVYQERRRECGWGLYEALGIAKGDREASARNRRRRTSPCSVHRMWPSSAATRPWARMAPWIAARMWAASCWPRTAWAWAPSRRLHWQSYPGVLREVLGIGEDRSIVCGISFGMADTAHPANHFRTTRADPASSVVWRD